MPTPQPSPSLAPGLRVVRRGLHHLQVGLHDGRRVLLPRTEVVQRALTMLLERRLDVTTLATDPGLAEVLERLQRNGCLAWGRERGRAPATVAVLGDPPVPGVPGLAELFGTAGLCTTTSAVRADVVVVASWGELDRERLDPLVRDARTHLVVRLVDGDAVLGPFVVPGTTPCLRCIDAHQAVADPDHVAVTARYVRASALPRPDGVPDLDPTLVSLARAWAARDVIAHLDGHEPSTWSRTIVLAAEPARRREQEWLRHPGCGCCWSAYSPASGTMG